MATIAEQEFYYTVIIPFSERPTAWHPTERTGPFRILSCGAFPAEALARAWAHSRLAGNPYSVRRIDYSDNAWAD